MARVWATFDDWTLTGVGQRGGQLQMNGYAQDGEIEANWTPLVGSISLLRSVIVTRGNGVGGTWGRTRMVGATVQNGRVYGEWTCSDVYSGFYARGQDTNDQDNYFCFARGDNGNLETWRMDNAGIGVLATTAGGYNGGQRVRVYMSLDAGGVSLVDELNGITVARVADTTYTAAGNVGLIYANPLDYNSTMDWIQVYTSALSGTAISTTLDAGSAVEFNGLCADVSASGGSVTFDVLASSSAGGPHTTVSAGLTVTNGAAAFTAAQTYRYWQTQIHFTRSDSTQNVGVTAGSVRLAEGLSASGSGSTTVITRQGTSGGGEARSKVRTVLVTDSQAQRIIRAARKPYPII